MVDERIELRPYREGDSLAEITELLHRAYAALGARGLNFVSTDQDVSVTADRVTSGHTVLAFKGEAIVGTVTVYRPDREESCELYQRESVYHFGQFAVEPSLQGEGIGRRLLLQAEEWARRDGALELALDTAEPASELIELYARWGYRPVGFVQWGGRHYRSVLMSKLLG